MKQLIFLILAFLSFNITAQTYRHGGGVKIKRTPTASASDKVLAITPNNLVVETDILVQDLSNTSALISLDDGNGTGFVLDIDRTNFGNIGLNAVDISARFDNNVIGALGEGSFTSGIDVTAGDYATSAIGYDINIGSSNSFYSSGKGAEISITGVGNHALGSQITMIAGSGGSGYNFATGRNIASSGVGGSSSGLALLNKSVGTTVVGTANLDYTLNNSNPNLLTDPVFIVGNGTLNATVLTANVRSDAFKILKNGEITAPSTDIADITNAGNKSLITKEYLEANSSGGSVIDIAESGTNHYALENINLLDIGTAAGDNVNLGFFNGGTNDKGIVSPATSSGILAGYNNTINSSSSGIVAGFGNTINTSAYIFIGGGLNNTASGITDGIIAGNNNNVSGGYNFAGGGNNNTITGTRSTTLAGQSNLAEGHYSATIAGEGLVSKSIYETVLGSYNSDYTPTGGNNNFNAVDKVFDVGNGASSGSRSSAFTVYKNGAVQLHPVTLASITNPTVGMLIIDSSDSNRLKFYDGTAWRSLTF